MGSSCRIDASCIPDGENSSVDNNPNASPLPTPRPATLGDPSERPTWVRWQMIVILMAFTGLNHFHRQSLPSVVDSVMHDCRFTVTEMGWIFSAFYVGYDLFMIPGGWLSDRRGGKAALV